LFAVQGFVLVQKKRHRAHQMRAPVHLTEQCGNPRGRIAVGECPRNLIHSTPGPRTMEVEQFEITRDLELPALKQQREGAKLRV